MAVPASYAGQIDADLFDEVRGQGADGNLIQRLTHDI